MHFDTIYNRQEFLKLLQTKIFPNFIRNERPLQLKRKTAYFVEGEIFRLGTVELDQEISILEIQQRSSKDPRITLTKDAFKLLDDNGIDTAIVIFHSPDNTSYRLSLLTTKYIDWDKKTTSSYKRFSYILGPGEKTKTPEKQLLRPISDYDDLVSRFDVEVVRKDFFEKYLELYVRLYKEIKKDQEFEQVLVSQNIDIVSFTKNLLGKIIFLYFIQQKGWLGLGHKEKEYGKGNKNFMRVMRDNFKYQNESMSTEKTGYFYNDYLEWLFFAGLNIDRRDQDDWFPNLQMKVPYLNGGLFREEYQGREKNIAKIDNDIFSNVETKGDEADGILDIFDRYNFTIDEDSLYDSDIAVDPEMLGRIFEKMISISKDNIDEVVELYDNKGKKTKIDFGKELNKKLGAFYTPREIVHYMTKESLIAYLINNISGDKESNEKLIRALFGLKEKFLINAKELENTEFEGNILDKLKDRILEIDEALKKVKILDPAVGSGAFPMGILHEISSIRYYSYGVFHEKFKEVLDEYKNSEGNLSLYKFKKEIILNNIYGVDIDPGAIDIARLRFWLSLVVEEETPEPLPNFEFKFVCANTLIPLDEETKQKDLFAQGDEPKLETLKRYKRDFYNASSNKEKENLKERIREYTKIESTLFSEPTPRARQIAEFGANFDNSKHSHSFFDPSLMMSEWRGFDIVIGNPPYVSTEKIAEPYKSQYAKIYKDIHTGRTDIYTYFYKLSYKLLKQGGISTFITSNKWMRAEYGGNLREYLAKNTVPLKIIDLGPNVFETATVDSNILIGEKNKIIKHQLKGLNLSDKSHIKDISYYHDQAIIMSNLSGDIWVLSTEQESKIKNKIEKKGISLLKRDIDIKFGIKTGYNEAFIITESVKKEIVNLDPNSLDIIKPILRGKDIKKYGYEFNNLWMIITKYGSYKYLEKKYPVIYKHLKKYEEKLKLRGQCQYKRGKTDNSDFPGQHHRLELDNNPTDDYLNKFEGEKIMFSRIVKSPQYYYDKNGFYIEATGYIITGSNLKYLLALLNTNFVYWIFHKFYSGGGIDGEIKIAKLKQLPIPKISETEQKPFVELVDKILKAKETDPNADTSALEKEIDQMVYELYGLTDEEIEIVEDGLK